ncbi:MAG: M3 family oligoendopeptidase, partial [Traorella sp.]
MKFSEYQYERPNLEEVQKQYAFYLEQMKQASTCDELMELIKKVNKMRNHISSMMTLSSLRYTINTADEFYAKENDYWDENSPFYQQLDTHFYKVILESPFLEELKERIPAPFFGIISCQLKAFDDCILEDLQRENKVSTEYDKLKASAKIEFEGKEYTLPGISALCESKDRNVRKRASQAKFDFYTKHEAEFDRIYDDLVHIRDTMAKKLGFKNFTELGYVRMTRLDYNEEMVSQYRKEVLENVVPLANELVLRQKQRLGLDKMQYYDLGVEFESGNPTPKGTPEELVAKALKMYHELSKETGEFFDMMVEKELLDLVSKPNKAGGG